MGCPLEVHTAQRALRHCIRRAVLNEICLEPMLRKFLRTEHPREAATRIPCRGGLDEPGIREDRFNKLHRFLRRAFARHRLEHPRTVPARRPRIEAMEYSDLHRYSAALPLPKVPDLFGQTHLPAGVGNRKGE